MLGRTIQPEDGLTGVPPVTLISHDFWTSRYAGSPEVLGEEIRIDRVARRIVGVLPSGFRFPNQEGDFWIPLGDSSSGEERYGLNTLAVLKRGVTPEALKAEVDGLLAGVSQDGQVWPSAFQPTVPPESIHSRPCSRF